MFNKIDAIMDIIIQKQEVSLNLEPDEYVAQSSSGIAATRASIQARARFTTSAGLLFSR